MRDARLVVGGVLLGQVIHRAETCAVTSDTEAEADGRGDLIFEPEVRMVAEPAAANRYSREFLAVTGVAYTCRYMENPFVLPDQGTAGDERRRYIMQADTGVDTLVFVGEAISRIVQ